MKESSSSKVQAPHMHWAMILWKSFNAADLALSQRVAICSEHGQLRSTMKLLEISGHGILWLSGTCMALFKVQSLDEKVVFFNLLFALIIDLIVIGVLKASFRRPRPVYNKGDMFVTVSVDKFSFPSGHATRVAMVSVFFLEKLMISFTVRLLLVTWAFCVGISRVILGRHHVSDVVVGFVVGYLQYRWILIPLWLNEGVVSYLLNSFHI
ncbi:polyisoprenoid diphosphate/phosphate phosphohydrolase PLPP6-like [Clavelina lepadiformis]|uniref:polyisoprenoid diphosphate/phosphate phosphohydrolase PLPP6-like n=1 Tax=Clavelina lepadiformis TaxID=159417 RepID=UPI004042F6B9